MNPAVTSSQTDTSLELLIDELADLLQAGESIDLAAYADQHPDHAEPLRKLIPALEMMVHLKRSAVLGAARSSPPDRGPEPELGELGDFRLVREIGRGGMGIVYEAEQISLRRRVALKVLPFAAALDARQIQRFQVEAQAAACLHHPHIVPVHGVGCERGVHYYAMQLIDGQSLAAIIGELRRLDGLDPGDGPAPDPAAISTTTLTERLLSGDESERPDGTGTGSPAVPVAGGGIPPEPPAPATGRDRSAGSSTHSRDYVRAAARLALQAAEALDHAHARGILHRDIKPGNLLLDAEGRLWVTDFGLAQIRGDDRLTLSGDVLGTLRYMSPEQALGRRVVIDGRTDIYSLGVTLYELLTLRPAFDGRDRAEVLRRIAEQEPAPPRRLNPAVPRDLETIISKAMDKDPQGRYPTADALAEDLRRFLADEPIQARRVGPLERAWIWARRRPAAAALLLVSGLAALALVGAGVAFIYNRRLEAKNVQLAKANDLAEFQRYFHHIARAAAGWREGNMVGVEKLLDECPTERRNWEWHYLKRLCHTDLLTLRGHTEAVKGVAYSPDGTRLASASSDGTVRVWDAITGREVLPPLRGHMGVVHAVAYGPDGKQLATAGDHGTLKIWDLATGQSRPLIGHIETEHVTSVAFSPHGRRLVSGDTGGTVRVWDMTTAEEVPFSPLKGHTQGINGVAYSPDGRWLSSVCGGSLGRLWDATTGEKVPHLPDRVATSGATAVAFSPDGRQLASASLEGIIKLWDVATGRLLLTLTSHPSAVMSVAFSPDGHRLASASMDGTIEIWTLRATGAQEQSNLEGIRRGLPVKARALAPTSAQEPLALKGHTGSAYHVVFSPDGMQLASASADGTIKIWDARSDPEARTLEGFRVKFSPDGKWLASATYDAKTFKLWDTTSAQVIRTFTGHNDQVLGIAFSPDGKWIASGANDKTVRLWHVATGQQAHPFERHGVFSLAFSPDGRWIASGNIDRTVTLWEVATGQALPDFEGHKGIAIDLAFSPDGTQIVCGDNDGTVRLWDSRTRELIGEFEGTRSPCCFALTPDGKRIATSTEDRTIKLWDVRTGEQVGAAFVGNTATISGLAFTPDGKRLASVSKDGTVKFWDVDSRQEALVLRGHTSWIMSVALTPDGTRLATADNDCKLKVWDARPWTPDAAIEREALGLLDSLFAKPLSRADVLDYLGNAPTIRPRTRQLALSLVDGYQEEQNPETYQQESWAVVRQPYLNAIQYRFALLQAKHACHLAPDRQENRLGLGAALYRAGRYREAVETLGATDQTSNGSPAALAFLAKAHHRLGQPERARAAVSRLRQLVKEPEQARNDEAQAFLHEVEAIEPDLAFPIDPFAR